MRLFDLVVALLHVKLVELGLVVAIDAAVSRARHGVDGALALLESAGRDLGGVCGGHVSDIWHGRAELCLRVSKDGRQRTPLIAHPPLALGRTIGRCDGHGGNLLGAYGRI